MTAPHRQAMVVYWTVCLLPLFLLSVLAKGESPPDVDAESAAFIEKAKSADPNVREQAVREIVGIREAVADELKRIVADANAGLDTSTSAAKASALYLSGEWGLVQNAELVSAEKTWVYRLELPSGWPAYTLHGHMRNKEGGVGRIAASRLAMASGVRVSASRYKTGLASVPALAQAISELRSRDDGVFEKAESDVFNWYRCIEEGLASALKVNNTHLYSDETKIGLAFLAGEYRIHDESAFLASLDLRDDMHKAASYPCAMEVDSPDAGYPSIIGLIKCGFRTKLKYSVYKLGDGSTSAEGRQRLARALMIIGPEVARKEFEKYHTYMQSNPRRRENDNAEVLARLDSVKAIVDQAK